MLEDLISALEDANDVFREIDKNDLVDEKACISLGYIQIFEARLYETMRLAQALRKGHQVLKRQTELRER